MTLHELIQIKSYRIVTLDAKLATKPLILHKATILPPNLPHISPSDYELRIQDYAPSARFLSPLYETPETSDSYHEAFSSY